jgi:propanediol dehydratase large subunit
MLPLLPLFVNSGQNLGLPNVTDSNVERVIYAKKATDKIDILGEW